MIKKICLQWAFVILSTLLAMPSWANIETKEHQLDSTLAKQSLKIKVVLPYGYDASKTYPVMYTTSGATRLEVLTHHIDWLSHVAMGPMPQMILVRIPAIDVESDLHPKDVAASGIANKLQLQVLQHEVMPLIDKRYKTQGFNIIEGFSSNGNFPLYVYLTEPSLFQGYIVASPALELDKSGLVTGLVNSKITDVYNNTWLSLSLGPFESNKPLFNKIKQAFDDQSRQVQFSDFSKMNFLSVATLSFDNAVGWLFSDLSPSAAQFAQTGAKGVEDYYKRLAVKYNKEHDANSTLISLSFYYAEQKQFDRALKVINDVHTRSPSNVYYMTRKAKIESLAGKMAESKRTLLKAQKHAQKANNQDALSYIKGQLSLLK